MAWMKPYTAALPGEQGGGDLSPREGLFEGSFDAQLVTLPGSHPVPGLVDVPLQTRPGAGACFLCPLPAASRLQLPPKGAGLLHPSRCSHRMACGVWQPFKQPHSKSYGVGAGAGSWARKQPATVCLGLQSMCARGSRWGCCSLASRAPNSQPHTLPHTSACGFKGGSQGRKQQSLFLAFASLQRPPESTSCISETSRASCAGGSLGETWPQERLRLERCNGAAVRETV